MSQTKHNAIRRRDVLISLASIPWVLQQGLAQWNLGNSSTARIAGFFFTSMGKTGLFDVDAGELKYLNWDMPGQATWQPGAFFEDGRRVIVLSMEPRRDGPGRPFEEFYTQTPTHLWEYRVGQPDLDHFNRDFKPELARGGTQICRLDPATGSIKSLCTVISTS